MVRVGARLLLTTGDEILLQQVMKMKSELVPVCRFWLLLMLAFSLRSFLCQSGIGEDYGDFPSDRLLVLLFSLLNRVLVVSSESITAKTEPST